MAQNVLVTLVMMSLIAAYVWAAWRNAPTREELEKRERERHAFILRSIQMSEKKERQRLLAEQWNNPPEWSPPPFFGTLTAAYDVA